MKFIVETSARHIHVTERTLAILFGSGKFLLGFLIQLS